MEIIIVLILEIICGLFLPKNTSSEIFSILCIFINTIVVFIFISKKFRQEYIVTVFIAYLLRLALLFADYYKWFPILHSGADTESLHRNALTILELKSFDTFIYTNYGYFTGSIYMLIGPQRLFLQYLNVLFGVGAIYFVYKSLLLLKLNNTHTRLFLLIMCFLPHNIIFSGILLRESLMIFAVSISVCLFVKWIYYNKIHNFMFSCCFILLATWMHSGMIGIFISYLMAYTFYNCKTGKIVFSLRSAITVCISIAFLIYLISNGIFTTYFDDILEAKDVTSTLLEDINKDSMGGSKYLAWIKVNSLLQTFLFSPLKMFYFLFSPIPFDWRGLGDIIGFCFSSMFFLYLSFLILRGLKHITRKQDKVIVKFLLIAMLITTFIYGYGVFAAGPAMRHRTKIFPALIVAAAISYNYKEKSKIKTYYDGNKNISDS
jgi:hypothetical protein